MIKLIDNYYSKVYLLLYLFQTQSSSASESVKKFVQLLSVTYLWDRDYNLGGSYRTDMNDLHLLIDADLEAQVDVDV